MNKIDKMNDKEGHRLGIGIIGCGLVGAKRAMALSSFSECRLKVVYDTDPRKARDLAERFGCSVGDSPAEIFDDPSINLVIVSTINKYLVPNSMEALRAGKHVLCEKPPGRNFQETKSLFQCAEQVKAKLKIGFNHRFHPAIVKAKEMIDHGEIGPVYFIHCHYGHGGRPCYEKEWRANRELSGGGELLDQGIHVIDLFRWFISEFEEAFGYTPTYFWNMRVEDNAFALFKTAKSQVASMHTSWTQWKNRFSFEIYSEAGYLIVEGLGGNYGTETLRIGKRRLFNKGQKPQDLGDPITNNLITNNVVLQYAGGAPDEEIIEFSSPDISWEKEWMEFLLAIKEDREPTGNGKDGLEAMRMIEAVYLSAHEHRPVKLQEIK